MLSLVDDRLVAVIAGCNDQRILSRIAPMASNHLSEGAARRLMMMRENLRSIAGRINGRTTALGSYEALDLTIHLNSFYVHLRGTLDNLAWTLQYHVRLLGPGDESDLQTRKKCGLFDGRFRKSLAQHLPQLDTNLSAHDEWARDVSELRDPVAHRIPLYVTPGVIAAGSEEERQINAIHETIHEIVRSAPADQDTRNVLVSEVARLMRDAQSHATYKPILVRSGPNGRETVRMVEQMIDDLEHMVAVGESVLRELTLTLNSNVKPNT